MSDPCLSVKATEASQSSPDEPTDGPRDEPRADALKRKVRRDPPCGTVIAGVADLRRRMAARPGQLRGVFVDNGLDLAPGGQKRFTGRVCGRLLPPGGQRRHCRQVRIGKVIRKSPKILRIFESTSETGWARLILAMQRWRLL